MPSSLQHLVNKYCNFGLLIFAVSTISQATEKKEILNICNLLNARLSLMTEVAQYKALHHLSVEDIKREALVLDTVSMKAEKYHLDPLSMRHFFQEQMNLGKVIQYRYRADHLLGKYTEKEIPFNTIREKLTDIGLQLTESIANYINKYGSFSKNDLNAFINTSTPYLTEEEKRRLTTSFISISKMHAPKNTN